MARQAVVDCVTAALAAWTGAPVFDENSKGSTPTDGSPFVVVQYPWARADQISFSAPGENIWRDEGAFRFVIHVPSGGGLTQGRQWADQLADLFRGKDLTTIQTGAPTPAAVDDWSSGTYAILSLSVPYRHDYIA